MAHHGSTSCPYPTNSTLSGALPAPKAGAPIQAVAALGVPGHVPFDYPGHGGQLGCGDRAPRSFVQHYHLGHEGWRHTGIGRSGLLTDLLSQDGRGPRPRGMVLVHAVYRVMDHRARRSSLGMATLTRAEQAPAPNRRPRFPLGASRQFEYLVCAPPAAPAAVGEAQR